MHAFTSRTGCKLRKAASLRGADLSARVQGATAFEVAHQAGHAAVGQLLAEEARQQQNASAAAILSRQAEASGIATARQEAAALVEPLAASRIFLS